MSVLLLYGFALSACLLALTAADTVSVSVLFSSQIRGAAMPVDLSGPSCVVNASNDVPVPDPSLNRAYTECYGGAARREQYIRDWKASVPETIVLDGGSSFWGGYMYYSFQSPTYMADLMSAAQYDAIAFSEADFLDGPNVLKSFVNRMNVTGNAPAFLASNIDVSNEPALAFMAGKLKYKIINVSNILIGVFSIIDTSVATHSQIGSNIIFNPKSAGSNVTIPTAAIIGRVSAELRQLGCAAVIMITSQRADVAIADVQSVGGVDLVLTSHYNNTNSIPIAPLFQVLPTFFSQSDLFMVTGTREYYGSSILSVDLFFTDGKLNLSISNANEIVLNSTGQATVTGIPSTWSLVKSYFSALQTNMSNPIGYTVQAVEGTSSSTVGTGVTNCRFTDCPMGRVLTTAIAQWCGKCDVVMINGAGIRGSFPSGPITWTSIKRAFPFGNTLSYFTAPGSTILAALINSITYKGTSRGAFLQVWGMRFAIDQQSQTVLEVQIYDNTRQAYVPLDLLKVYTIGTYSFLRAGGSDYSTFAQTALDAFDFGPTDNVVATQFLSRFTSTSQLNFLASQNLTQCSSTASIPLDLGAGPCLIVTTTIADDIRLRCPSQVSQCSSAVGSPLEGVFYNSSTCARCSGLGSCANQICTCAVPTSGLYKDLPVIQGKDCSQVAPVVAISNGAIYFLYALAALTVVVSGSTAIVLLTKSSHPLILATAPRFGAVTCLGGILAAASIICVTLPQSNAVCQAWIWLTCLSHSMMFASVFARTYRIDRIFNSDSLHRVIISDMTLLKIISSLIVVDVAILSWWQAANPMLLIGQMVPSSFAVCTICTSTSSTHSYLMFAYKSILTVWGIYLAVSVRKVSDNFNESKFIGMSIYNAAVASLIVIPVIYKVQLSNHDMAQVLTGVLVGYVAIFTLLVLYAPRFYELFTNGGATTAASSTNRTSKSGRENSGVELQTKSTPGNRAGARNSSKSGATLSLNSIWHEVVQMRAEVATLTQEREILLERLAAAERNTA